MALRSFEGARFRFSGVALSADGQHAVSTGDALHYWDLQTGTLVSKLKTPEGVGAVAVDISSDGHLAAAAEPGVVSVWDLAKSVSIRDWPATGIPVAIHFSPDAERVWFATDQFCCAGSVKLPSPPSCSEFPQQETGRIIVGAFAGEGRIVLASAGDGRLLVWDHEQKRIVKRWRATRDPRGIVDVDTFGERAAAIGSDSVIIGDLSGITVPQAVPVRQGPAISIAVSDDGSLLLVGTETGAIQLVKL